ncbi:hypothetical protein [Moraxella atlantae]|uniref:Uncharacterized protein n=1 Tax=Faucicola atlantae TaxID=34059 RepID=A0A378QL81_9GAMM|nr:hypothetical protein [Moraxella atlantae]STZ01657.1 Uncharacterised protein [Moraxella atlantae]
MDYKYLAKNHIGEQQTIIVRDYFETPLETHGNHLDHLTHICQYYNISAPLLRIMVSHFKIYDTQTRCRECNIMRQIYEPTYQYQQQHFNWICDDCHQFIQQQFNRSFSLAQYYNEDDDCPF